MLPGGIVTFTSKDVHVNQEVKSEMSEGHTGYITASFTKDNSHQDSGLKTTGTEPKTKHSCIDKLFMQLLFFYSRLPCIICITLHLLCVYLYVINQSRKEHYYYYYYVYHSVNILLVYIVDPYIV